MAPEIGKNWHFNYLVTNRHVAMCWNDSQRPLPVSSINVRINKKNGTAETIVLNDSENANWILPSDESVDLAVIPFEGLRDDHDYMATPLDLFATTDVMYQERIAEGASILVAGYFLQFPGERRFEPILRKGTLSMIPDEPMMTTTGKSGKVYLADIHIFGGNSGFPVLVTPAENNVFQPYYFLGVVSGYYFEDEDFKMEIATTVMGKARANSGIAMIVPADEVKKLLDDPKLRAIREENVRALAPKPAAQ
jgi:hypothetical protein